MRRRTYEVVARQAFFRVLDPTTAAQYVTMLTDYVAGAQELYDGTGQRDAVGIKATNDGTFEIKLKAPSAQFLDILSIWSFSPIQQATVEANGDKWTLAANSFVTNGAFKVGDIQPGKSLTMVKNENYWDAATFYLMNNAKPPFDNLKVRETFSLAIDRQSLIDNVLKSSDAPAFSPIAPGYVVNGKDYAAERGTYGLNATAQVDTAKAALAEAGYPDGQSFPEIELYYYTDPRVKLVTEAMAQMLRDNLNIKVTTPTKEWKAYFDDVQAGKYQVAAMGWGADYFHPMTFFPVFKSTDPANNSGWRPMMWCPASMWWSALYFKRAQVVA